MEAANVSARLYRISKKAEKMKRILIFSLAYIPFVGGAELSIKEIADRLDQKEFEFEMITFRFDSKLSRLEKVGNVKIHRIGLSTSNVKVSDRALPWQCRLAKLLFPISAFLKAMSLHREKKFNMVWASMANQAGFAALFFKLTHPKISYLLDLQDGTPLSEMKKRRPITVLIWPLYRAIYRYADVVKTISNFIAGIARDAGYQGKIEVIPNGVDVAKFSAAPPEGKLLALKNKFGKKIGDVFLFTASRLVLSRGVEDIILALPLLPASVKLLIAGDGEDRRALERISEETGVKDRVVFAGHVEHDEIPKYLKISDIFVRPSIIEGMGSAFIEAFAAGIPVIATPVGGITDFLYPPEKSPEPTGLFCNVRDPKSIAEKVKEYMEHPTLVSRVMKNAQALAEQKYDWQLITNTMKEKIFAKL